MSKVKKREAPLGPPYDTFSHSAADLVQIATLLAGFDRKAVLLQCYARSRAEKVNIRTVEAVLGEFVELEEAAL